MRKIVCFSLGILVSIFSFSALASKARMSALGGENTAYYYFNDTRNVLINPAYVNINKDFIIFEWGKDVDAESTTEAAPKPEGGFFKSFGYFIYGLYLGSEEGYEGRNNVAVSTPPTFLYQDNPIEFFIAGNAGVEWGASIKFSQSMDETTNIKREQSSLKVNLGALVGAIEGRLTFDLFDKSTGGSSAQEEYKAGLGYTLGANYFFKDIIFYGKYSKSGYEYRRAIDGMKDIERDRHLWEAGAGQSLQLNEKAKMYYDLHYTFYSSNRTSNIATSATKEKTQYWRIPVTLGLESSVREWLILRGNISQYLLSKETNAQKKGKTSRQTTTVSGGATLDWGKLKIDGLIGTTDTSGNINKTGVLSLSNLLTQVSMVYWF